MPASVAFIVLLSYFLLLIFISWRTSRNSSYSTFFNADKSAPWYVVAFGMVGATLSGVTFVSVPGDVVNNQFAYFQVVLGYIPGYLFIAFVLLPIYYKFNLTTIYGYLEDRLGWRSYKTGAAYFILSRIVGASFRLYLVAVTLHVFIFEDWNIPFYATILIAIGLIWVYTFKGGIKTVVYTDTLQTFFMLLALIISIVAITTELDWSFKEMALNIQDSRMSKIFFFSDSDGPKFFWKQFFSGAFIAIVMTGLDQDMMQKNLSCRNLGDAQKNMLSFIIVLVLANFLFLSFGVLMYEYASAFDIDLPSQTDELYPLLASDHLPVFAGVIFLLGITAAAYSSADSALTSLTTSFLVDFLEVQKKGNQSKKLRNIIHFSFSLILFIAVMIFHEINDRSVIQSLFLAAGYTYGPLLGLFFFGIFTPWKVHDRGVPIVCIISPLICYILDQNSANWFHGYKFGFEILILNGFITFLGLFFLKRKKE